MIVDSIIEEVVTFQHGGLNNSVDTMAAAVSEYSKGLADIAVLRGSLVETKSVLTAKKSGQVAMRDLWAKRKELEEMLRILTDLEWLKVRDNCRLSGKSRSATGLSFASAETCSAKEVFLGGSKTEQGP